jgi:PadR family transcriptional regulator PadR
MHSCIDLVLKSGFATEFVFDSAKPLNYHRCLGELVGKKPDVLQGTLDLLILKTLSRGPQHGYGIAASIEAVTDDVLRVEEGSLYPALHRMEQSGLIAAEWQTTENKRRARLYRLTLAGQNTLGQEQKKWSRFTAAVAKVLGFA